MKCNNGLSVCKTKKNKYAKFVVFRGCKYRIVVLSLHIETKKHIGLGDFMFLKQT